MMGQALGKYARWVWEDIHDNNLHVKVCAIFLGVVLDNEANYVSYTAREVYYLDMKMGKENPRSDSTSERLKLRKVGAAA
jgi:hypothetical protein